MSELKGVGAGTSELDFEQALERLETIVGRLDQGEAALEESLGLFEEGVALTKRCHALLERAEERIRRLVKDPDGGLSLEAFQEEGGEE